MKRIFDAFVKRPIKNWNIDNRAEKVIEKIQQGHITPSPRHTESMDTENRDVRKEEKNEELHTMLHGMVVEPDRVQEIARSSSKESESTENVESSVDHGYIEPSKFMPGKCSIKQSLDFIGAHHDDPQIFSPAAIAEEYNLDENDVNNVLNYFCLMDMDIKKGKGSQDLLMEQHNTELKLLLEHSIQQLTPKHKYRTTEQGTNQPPAADHALFPPRK